MFPASLDGTARRLQFNENLSLRRMRCLKAYDAHIRKTAAESGEYPQHTEDLGSVTVKITHFAFAVSAVRFVVAAPSVTETVALSPTTARDEVVASRTLGLLEGVSWCMLATASS